MRLAAAALLLLGGCSFVSGVAGVAAGTGASAATANPAVGFAVGIGVRSAVDALLNYVTRRRQAGEQDAIATAAGAAPLNGEQPWEIRHTIPIGDARGTLLVTREFVTPLATCREVVFAVVDGEDRQLLTTMACLRDGGWAWSAAEPAVSRWGGLQR